MGQRDNRALPQRFPRCWIGAGTDLDALLVPDCSGMAKQERATESHAAIWRDANGALVTGKVVLGADALRLQGMTRQGSSSVDEVPYAELAGVGIGRGPEERLNGRPTLVLNRSSAPPLLLDVLGIGMLSELSDLLATLAAEHAAPREHLTVIGR